MHRRPILEAAWSGATHLVPGLRNAAWSTGVVIKRAWQDRDDALRWREARAFLMSAAVESIGEDLGISREAIRATVRFRF